MGQAGALYPHEQQFLGNLVLSAQEAGATVTGSDEADLVFAWHGRAVTPRDGQRVFWCECGWLPRWHFQMSESGINSAHHLAGTKLKSLGWQRRLTAERYLDWAREAPPPAGFAYANPTPPPVSGAPYAFIFAPLQVEADTNMEHVDPPLRSPQGFIDYVEQWDLPLPVVFKAHPASTARHGNLRVHHQNRLVQHNAGTIHQWLKHPGCRMVVTLNSNTANDALLWNVPVVTLAPGIWPTDGPFFHGLGGELSYYEDKWRTKARQALVLSYVDFLIRAQWTMDQAKDVVKVSGVAG